MITLNKLHKEIGKAIEQGWGYRYVYVNKKTFSHPLESDGAVILPVENAEIESFPMIDDDGFSKTRKDGTEIDRIGLILTGEQQ
jgi:hypothetical protein